MKIKTILFLLLFFALNSTLFSQNTGTVQLKLFPYNTILKIGDSLYHYKNVKELELVEGNYPIELWAPQMAVVKDTLQVVAGKKSYYVKGLKTLSPAFKEYKKQKSQYDFKTFTNYSTDVLLLTGNIMATYWVFNKGGKYQSTLDQANEAKNFYEKFAISPDDLNQAKLNYERSRADYDKARKNHNLKKAIGIPLLIISYGLSSYYYYKRVKTKRKKPSYKEENPFNFHNVTPSIGYQNNQLNLGLSLRF